MKEAIVHPGPRAEIIDSPVPEPGPDQIVTKVVVTGTNPKDWKLGDTGPNPINQGDDIAGVVHAVGGNVTEFKPGDRIAAFHEMLAPGGSYAEYAVKAATIPLAAVTAAIGLYERLRLPLPWQAITTPLPLIIYGASSAVGSYAIQLASLSNIHPIIAIAGGGSKHVETLIDTKKGDIIVDYRNGNDALVSGIKDALQKNGLSKIEYAFDAISEKGSYQNICQVLDAHGQITLFLPGSKFEGIPETVTKSVTSCKCVFADVDPESAEGKAGVKTGSKEFGFVFFRFFGRALQQGWLRSHPYEVVPGGLGGVETALRDLKEGKASAVKYVLRIADTSGVSR